MTKLNKDVARETNTEIKDRGKNRFACITLRGGSHGDSIELRLKGTQVKYTVTVREVWELGRQKAMRAAGF